MQAIRARIRAPDERDRELTTALLTARDDRTPGPDAPGAAPPARPHQRPAPARAASPRVRRLC